MARSGCGLLLLRCTARGMWDLLWMENPRQRVRAAIGLLALAATSTLSLTACTPPTAGSTGVTVDREGHLVLVLALCEAHLDGATIYRDRTKTDPVADDPTISAGSWEMTAPNTVLRSTHVELDTVAPSQGWTPREPLEGLRPGVHYTAYGWTRDNSWSSGDVEFTIEQLARLRPGQVLFQRYDEQRDSFVDAVDTSARFRADACDEVS